MHPPFQPSACEGQIELIYVRDFVRKITISVGLADTSICFCTLRIAYSKVKIDKNDYNAFVSDHSEHELDIILFLCVPFGEKRGWSRAIILLMFCWPSRVQ
jgi:hypothetical protein